MSDWVGKRVRVKNSSVWLPPIAEQFIGETGTITRPAGKWRAWWVDFEGGEAWFYEAELEVLDASNPVA